MKVIKLIITVILLMFVVSEANSQTFKIVGYEDYSNHSQNWKQKDKAKYLGTQITMEFYQNDVKLHSAADNSNVVLTNVSPNRYEAKNGNDLAILLLTTWVKYIKRGELCVYRDGKIRVKILLERD